MQIHLGGNEADGILDLMFLHHLIELFAQLKRFTSSLFGFPPCRLPLEFIMRLLNDISMFLLLFS